MTGAGRDLVAPDGRPLKPEPSLTILQLDPNAKAPPPQVLQLLCQQTQSSVIVVPYGWQIMRGDLAENVLRGLHDDIHKALGLGEA